MNKVLRKFRRGFTLVELMIVVAIVGILAVLAVYGVRRYIANAKTAEARNSLGQIGKLADTAFNTEALAGAVLNPGASTGVVHAECASSSANVPAAIGQVTGMKYQPDPTFGKDWTVDAPVNKGFACLKYSMEQPQFYMYSYTSNGDKTVPTQGTQFSAVANGDLDGDGTTSTFTILGAVDPTSKTLRVAPNITELQPEE